MKLNVITINPFDKTVTKQVLEGGTAYDLIRAEVFKHRKEPGYLQHLGVGGGHGIYIDEEGLLMDWDDQAFFHLGDPDKGMPVAGIAVMVRDTVDGDIADCKLPLELVQSTVHWLDRKEAVFDAPVRKTMKEDGTIETTLLAGRETWDYQHQPA